VLHTKYLHFFEVSSYTTLSETVVADILDVRILDSAESNLGRLHIRLLPCTVYKKKWAPHAMKRCGAQMRRTKSQGSKENRVIEPEVLTCGDGKREHPTATPPKVGKAPTGADPRTVIAPARVEHARVAVGIFDGFVEAGDVRDTHVLHLLVRNGLADARDVTAERFAVAISQAELPQVFSCAIGLAFDFLSGHECDLVQLSSDEAMILVVAIVRRTREAGLRVVTHTVAGRFEPFDFLRSGKVKAGECDDHVAMLVALEREWITTFEVRLKHHPVNVIPR